MKKATSLITLVVLLMFVFVGCNATKNDELPTQNYEYTKSDEAVKPYITLEKDNKFTFMYSALSSYICVGTYEADDDYLTLKTDDEKFQYVFKIKNNTLVFNKEKSSKLPSFANVPNGAVFSDIRKVAWDKLSRESKKEIVGNWKEAECVKTIIDSKFMYLIDKSYENEEVYHVTFQTRNRSLGAIGVYLALDTYKIVGGDYRE